MDEEPRQPRDEARQPEAPRKARRPPSCVRWSPAIPCRSTRTGGRRSAFRARDRRSPARRSLPSCIAAGATPGTSCPFSALHRRQIADDEDVLVAGRVQRRRHQHAAGAIERHAERARQRRGGHAGAPQDGARGDALLARLEVHGDAAVVDAGDARVEVHLHAELRQLLARLVAAAPRDRRPSTCGAPSSRSTRAWCGSMRRKSRVSAWNATSLMAPASSTPVGPPPTTTKVSHSRCDAPDRCARSASSNAERMRLRISSASSMVLRPGATPCHSSWPKYECVAPVATTR